MLRFALHRLYFAVFGLMLLTLPLFALMRVPLHNMNMCQAHRGDFCEGRLPMVLLRNGPLYAVWQTGLPPNDYWPLAIVLLAAEGGAQMMLARRRARTI